MIENEPRLNTGCLALFVEIYYVIEVARRVNEQCLTNCLAVLRSATPSWQYRYALIPRNFYRGFNIINVLRNDNTDRHKLINRSIGAVAASTKVIK